MGELAINYSDKKVTPFGGMKLLKDFREPLAGFHKRPIRKVLTQKKS